MEREKVIELAKKAGFDASTAAGILQLGVDTGDDWFSCREEVLELVRLIEQETLERAAVVCETNAQELVFNDHAEGCRDCASDIRNLKDNHDKE